MINKVIDNTIQMFSVIPKFCVMPNCLCNPPNNKNQSIRYGKKKSEDKKITYVTSKPAEKCS